MIILGIGIVIAVILVLLFGAGVLIHMAVVELTFFLIDIPVKSENGKAKLAKKFGFWAMLTAGITNALKGQAAAATTSAGVLGFLSGVPEVQGPKLPGAFLANPNNTIGLFGFITKLFGGLSIFGLIVNIGLILLVHYVGFVVCCGKLNEEDAKKVAPKFALASTAVAIIGKMVISMIL